MLAKGLDPLAKRIGRKIRLVRKARGLSFAKAAEQLGITAPQLLYVEKGYQIPGPKLAKRLRNWMIAGATYEGAPVNFEKVWRLEAKRGAWKTLRVFLPPGTGKELYRLCRRLNMSAPELSLMAVELFLANRVGHITVKEARDHVARARAISAMIEAPELRDILECEMKIAITAGATLTPWEQVEAKTVPEPMKIDEIEKFELILQNQDTESF